MQHRCTPTLGRTAGISALLILAACPALARCGDGAGPRVDWAGCSKQQLMLGGDDLTGANLARAILSSTDFGGSKLGGAKLDQSEISFAKFEGANLAGASLVKAVGWQVNLKKVNGERANFGTAQLIRSTFTDARLAGADFTKAELNRSVFGGAKLDGVNLSKAELARADFRKASLSGVVFDQSNLSRAVLTGLDLSGVSFDRTYLYLTQIQGSDLTGAKGLTQAQVDLACGSLDTRLPKGLKAPGSWPCSSESEE